MSDKLSMSAAIKLAGKSVSEPQKRGKYGFSVYGPFHSDKPHGIRTESQYPSYVAARKGRTAWCAHVALCAMGYSGSELEYNTYYAAQHGGNLKSVILRAIPVSNKQA